MFICLAVCFLTLGLTLIDFLNDSSAVLNGSYLKNQTSKLLVFAAILIVLSWIGMHFTYFRVPFPRMKLLVEDLGNKLIRKEQNNTELIQDNIPEINSFILRYMYLISSFLLGGSYIGIEIYLVNSLIAAIVSGNSDTTIALAFITGAIPLFLFSWVVFVMSSVHSKNKFLALPVFVALAMLILIPISNMITSSTDSWLLYYIMFGPAASLIIFGIFSFIGMKLRRQFYLWSTVCCLIGFFPFLVCYYLIESNMVSNDNNGLLIGLVMSCW